MKGILLQGYALVLPLLVLVACSAHDEPREDERLPSALVDSWVRVYPPADAPDTLTLRADGTVRGSTAGLDQHGFPMTHWQIGDSVMLIPGGFCMGAGWGGTLAAEPPPGSPEDTVYVRRPRTHCQGFIVVGDTFALANLRRTVFVRASAVWDWQQLRSRFADGSGVPVVAPRPGDAVRGLPPASARDGR